MTQDMGEDEAGPFSVGRREFHNLVYPAAYNHRRDELWRSLDEAWWRAAAEALRHAGEAKGRLRPGLCLELAHAIDGALVGALPRAFMAAAGVITANQTREGVPHQVQAVAYVLACEYRYVVDRSPAKRVRERFGIGQRQWHRWREQYERRVAEDFLFVRLCEGATCQDLGRPWASLAVLLCLGLATDEEARELHLVKGGRILTRETGEEVWVQGGMMFGPDGEEVWVQSPDTFLPPDI